MVNLLIKIFPVNCQTFTPYGNLKLHTTHIASVACSEYIFKKTTRAGESYIARQILYNKAFIVKHKHYISVFVYI